MNTTKSQDNLDISHLKKDLKGRSVRGASVTLFAQSLKFIINTGSTMILARLLSPQDYGLIAMVWAIISFAFLFKDLGLSMATVQSERIVQDELTNLFWANVLFGAVVSLFFISVSPLVSMFYRDDRLVAITISLSVIYFVYGFAAQHQALLKRQMRFTTLAMIEVSAISLGILAAVVSALHGAGYWALVIKEISTAFFQSLFIWCSLKWLPGLPNRNGNVMQMLKFGAYLTGFNTLNYFARNLDNVLIGKYFGDRQLGLYSKAYQLLLLPINQINVPIANVAIPSLSRLQNEPERFRNYYCKVINIASFISMPIVVTLAILSNEVVLILLGNQWAEAGILFRILAIAAFGQTISQTIGWIFVSLGQTDRLFRWAMVSTPIIVASFVIGLPWGAKGVAIAYAISTNLLIAPLYAYALKKAPISITDIVAAIWRPTIISLGMGLTIILARLSVSFTAIFYNITFTITIGIFSFFLLAVLLPGAKSDLSNFKSLIRAYRSN